MKTYKLAEVIAVKDEVTTFGTPLLSEFKPVYEATIHTKLKDKFNYLGKAKTNELGRLNKDIVSDLEESDVVLSTLTSYDILDLSCNLYKPSSGLISRHGVYLLSSLASIIFLYNEEDILKDFVLSSKGIDNRDMLSRDCDLKETKYSYRKLSSEELKDFEDINLIIDVIVKSELFANVSSLTGIHFGNRESGNDSEEIMTNTRNKYFSDSLKKDITLSSILLSDKYKDSIFLEAYRKRADLYNKLDQLFKDDNILVSESLILGSIAILFGLPLIKLNNLYIIGKSMEDLNIINLSKELKEGQNV